MKNKYLIIIFFAFSYGFSQTILNVGEIAITSINADGSDDFSFLTFVDLAVGTEIKFTDNGCDVTTDDFGTATEGLITWTASSIISAGSEVQINTPTVTVSTSSTSSGNVAKSGSFNLSGGGDQILVYQGLDTSPNFIYAFTHRSGGFLTTSIGTSSLNTGLPSGLISGNNALATATHHDN